MDDRRRYMEPRVTSRGITCRTNSDMHTLHDVLVVPFKFNSDWPHRGSTDEDDGQGYPQNGPGAEWAGVAARLRDPSAAPSTCGN
jgi:hypothetical protein